MSEISMRKTMREHMVLLPHLHWQRVEDLCSVGIPDINFCYSGAEYWIEAKWLEAYPKRPSTPVRLGLTPEQALWLTERRRAGGRTCVVAKVGRQWLVFVDHFTELVRGMPREELERASHVYWLGAFDVDLFLGALRR